MRKVVRRLMEWSCSAAEESCSAADGMREVVRRLME